MRRRCHCRCLHCCRPAAARAAAPPAKPTAAEIRDRKKFDAQIAGIFAHSTGTQRR